MLLTQCQLLLRTVSLAEEDGRGVLGLQPVRGKKQLGISYFRKTEAYQLTRAAARDK